MIRVLFFLILGFAFLSFVSGQEILSDRIKGLRVYGESEASLPVVGLSSRPCTIEFDIAEATPMEIQVKFYHCDRDWKKTDTPFVNDEQLNRSKSEPTYSSAPTGVKGYTFHYSIKIPGYPLFDKFVYSGNYLFEIWEQNDHELLGRGRFLVVEDVVDPLLKISNRQEPSLVSPYYQVNKIGVWFAVPESDSARTFDRLLFSAVDVYRNREIYRPRRIDTDDENPNTFVEGYGTTRLGFVVDNVMPGNEYRNLDLRNIDFYPGGSALRPRLGADVSRFLGNVGEDRNGGSSIIREGPYADYLDFTFELLLDSPDLGRVYVVGDFNGWNSAPASEMEERGGRYLWRTSLRRGIYDYQYVLGDDWIILEGNDWRTVNTYSAFVYYHDPRFGGFDRIVGWVVGKSPGGSTATSN